MNAELLLSPLSLPVSLHAFCPLCTARSCAACFAAVVSWLVVVVLAVFGGPSPLSTPPAVAPRRRRRGGVHHHPCHWKECGMCDAGCQLNRAWLDPKQPASQTVYSGDKIGVRGYTRLMLSSQSSGRVSMSAAGGLVRRAENGKSLTQDT